MMEASMVVCERLSRARALRGEDLKAASSRTGLREGTVRAIEDGRFDALPPGIYARAANRTYASAMGLDPEEVLDACAPSLPSIEEPIRAMARLRGIRPIASPQPERTPAAEPASDESPAALPSWRWIGAAAIDAGIVGGMLVALIVIARVATAVPVATLGRPGAIAFAVMGILLSIAYYAWFGGLCGTTAGEQVLGLAAPGHPPRVTLNVVTSRAARCASDDLRFLSAAGAHCRQLWNAMVVAPPRATTCSSAPRDL
jgi:hypothetical protein